IDEKEGQKFRQTTKDRRVDVCCQPYRGFAGLFADGNQKSKCETDGKCCEGQRDGNQKAPGNACPPTVRAETQQSGVMFHAPILFPEGNCLYFYRLRASTRRGLVRHARTNVLRRFAKTQTGACLSIWISFQR